MATLQKNLIQRLQGFPQQLLDLILSNSILNYKNDILQRPSWNTKQNLLTNSEDFSNASWGKANSSISGSELIETVATAIHGVTAFSAIPAIGTYNLSIEAKANSRNRIAIGNVSGAGNYAIFDLATGTFVAYVNGGSAALSNAQITATENGYYRCSVTILSSGAISIGYLIVESGTTINYLGDGTSSLFVNKAQLVEGTEAGEYVKTEENPYSFENGTVQLNDYSNSNNGGLIHSGGGLSFDGVNDSVETNRTILNGLNRFTISAIIKPESSSNEVIFDQYDGAGDGVNVIRNSSGIITFRINGLDLNSNSAVSLNDTAYIDFVWNLDTAYIYINGALDNSVIDINRTIDTTSSFAIGLRKSTSNLYFTGDMYESKIYNRALSAVEVLQNYNNPQEPISTGLVAWYGFDEMSGDTVFDKSGNGNHGAIVGATRVSGVEVGYQPALGGFNVGTFELLDSIVGDTVNLDGAISVSITPDGNYAVALGLNSDSIVTYDISNKSNIVLLDSIVGDTVNLNAPRSVSITPDGNYAVAVGSGSDSIVTYDISNKSNIVLLDSIVGDAVNLDTPFLVSITSDGNYAVAVGLASNSIVTYDISNKSNIILLDSIVGDTVNLNGAISVSITPDGNYAVAVGNVSDSIVTYDISNKSNITLLDSIVGDTVNLDGPYSVAVTPDGNYAVAVGRISDSIVTYDISDKSNITLLDSIVGDTVNLDAPYSVTITPDGNYAVALGLNSDSIVTYDISDKSNITLLDSIVGDTVNLDGAVSVAITPDGNYAVAVGNTSDSIVTYDIQLPWTPAKRIFGSAYNSATDIFGNAIANAYIPNALNFSGSYAGLYVDAGANVDASGAFSFAGWINLADTNAIQMIFTNRLSLEGLSLYALDNGSNFDLKFENEDTSDVVRTLNSLPLDYGQWYFIALTKGASGATTNLWWGDKNNLPINKGDETNKDTGVSAPVPELNMWLANFPTEVLPINGYLIYPLMYAEDLSAANTDLTKIKSIWTRTRKLIPD